jgi:hypothetical protein
MTLRVVQSGLWQRADGSGFERFELGADGDGWQLTGTVLARAEGRAFEARYRVRCDTAWRTKSAEVRIHSAGSERALALTVEDGRWLADSREQPALRGALDVDLGWSPSTNTLPIRRLSLAVGAQSGPVVAAWVRFPELTLEPLPQEYERLAETRYRYSSRGGSFVAVLEVDEHGLVLDYEGQWRRVPSG